MLHYLLSDSSDKGGTVTPLMQMSKGWVASRALAERAGLSATASMENNRAARRVCLVTFESTGALDHAQALGEANFGKTVAELHSHTEHGITKQWEGAAIDSLDNARLRAHEAKRFSPTPQSGQAPAKPSKGRKQR